MSQPFKLYRLQQIDSLLDKARARLQEIDSLLSQDEALRQAQQRANQAAGELEERRKALRQTEQTVKDQRIKIETTEATLYGGKVRSPKELQDLQNEVAALKRFRSTLEDRQLDAMIAVEEAESSDAAAQGELETVQARLAVAHGALLTERDSLLKELPRQENERSAAAGSIPEEDLQLYEQLRKQRRGIAVAKVTGKACSACGSTLNAALLHAAHSPSQINRCDTCGRILYIG